MPHEVLTGDKYLIVKRFNCLKGTLTYTSSEVSMHACDRVVNRLVTTKITDVILNTQFCMGSFNTSVSS